MSNKEIMAGCGEGDSGGSGLKNNGGWERC